MSKKQEILRKVIITTIITVTLSHFFVLIPLDFGFFSSNKSGKIEQFDVYTDLIKRSDDIAYDDKIVVVTIPDKAGRAELTKALNLLAECQPAAIAMDIYLKDRKDVETDSLLTEAIKKNHNLILPCFTDKNQDTVPYLVKPGTLGTGRGFVNLDNQGEENAIIRTFKPYHINGNDTLRSLALEAVKLIYPEKLVKLDSRNSSHEYINYMRFLSCYNYTEIPYFRNELEDKIIILGMETAEDTHHTPIGSKLSGLKVHAYIASTVLMEDYIDRPPMWITTILTIIILALFSFLQVMYAMRYGRFAGFLVRSSTYVFFFAFLITGFIVFYEYSLYIDSVRLLLGVAFAPWSMDFYYIMEALYRKLKKKIENLINHYNNDINTFN